MSVSTATYQNNIVTFKPGLNMYCAFEPLRSLVFRPQIVTEYGETVERIFDPGLWQSHTTSHKFRCIKTGEEFYTSNPDAAHSYLAYRHIASFILTKDDNVQRLESSADRRNHKYRSFKYGQDFFSNSSDIHQSYKNFLIDIGQYHIDPNATQVS